MDSMSLLDLLYVEGPFAAAYLLAIGAIAYGAITVSHARLGIARNCFMGACAIFAGVAIMWGVSTDYSFLPRIFVVGVLSAAAGISVAETWRFFVHEETVAPHPKGLNAGGDSYGPGGAGGGGIGGPGGDAHGTGGGGGGGSPLAGGGGGGGENGQGGEGGFPGGGGGGGGINAPGGKGGSGLIKIEYDPIKVTEPPKNFFDLYQRESYAGGKASVEQLIVKSDGYAPVKVDITLGWGRRCESKNLWIFVPDGTPAFGAINAFLPIYPKTIEKLDIQARSGVSTPCVPNDSPDGFVLVSKNVYVYHVGTISSHQAYDLVKSYAGNGLALTLRGPDYFSRRKAHWSKEDSEKVQANSPHSIYMPGDP
jgi:hypothetical protein